MAKSPLHSVGRCLSHCWSAAFPKGVSPCEAKALVAQCGGQLIQGIGYRTTMTLCMDNEGGRRRTKVKDGRRDC